MGINKLIFENDLKEIKFYAPNRYRKFELGSISATIHGGFCVESEHFEGSYNNIETLEHAKKLAQNLFEKWVEGFSINKYRDEYIV